MISQKTRFAGLAAAIALAVPFCAAVAQQQIPAAPAPEAAPAAPAPSGPTVFPKADPDNFTASTPTKETINAFLQANWGYDPTRIWQIYAITKTQAEGVSRVVVLVGDTVGKLKQPAVLQFYSLPDGKHIIAGNDVNPFGEKPFADNRAMVQQRANGPYRGSAAKDLEIVEFADYQCPHCKEVQANMDKLVTDFPKARVVYQQYPLTKIHPEAEKASEYGVCVAKLGTSASFFLFNDAVFEGQEGLATADGATLTLNSAVTKAGLEPAKVAECAASAETKAKVDESVKLARDLNVNETPTLLINGRVIPVGGVEYDMLKKIVEFQAKLDGVSLQ